MTEDNDYETLRTEIEELSKRVDRLTTLIGLLAIFVIALVITYYLINSSGFTFIVLVLVLVVTTTICCWILEKRGI